MSHHNMSILGLIALTSWIGCGPAPELEEEVDDLESLEQPIYNSYPLPGGGGDTGTVQRYDYYCAFPEINWACIDDSHEDICKDWWCNGPEAFMYFGGYGGAKKGSTPAYLGTGGKVASGMPSVTRRTYNTDAWASNFRGPYVVAGGRTQYEWKDPRIWARCTSRTYPLTRGRACVRVPVGSPVPAISGKTFDVYEDDEYFNSDDYVGWFRILRDDCRTQVWSTGARVGWTAARYAGRGGSITQLRYRSWCYSCKNATSCTSSATNGIGAYLP